MDDDLRALEHAYTRTGRTVIEPRSHPIAQLTLKFLYYERERLRAAMRFMERMEPLSLRAAPQSPFERHQARLQTVKDLIKAWEALGVEKPERPYHEGEHKILPPQLQPDVATSPDA